MSLTVHDSKFQHLHVTLHVMWLMRWILQTEINKIKYVSMSVVIVFEHVNVYAPTSAIMRVRSSVTDCGSVQRSSEKGRLLPK